MWSIAQVCERSGLSARTVRYYEEIGLLPGVRRSEGGRRVYGDDELERLRFITRLKTLGLPLKEIRDLNAVYAIGGSTAAMLERLGQLLGAHLADVDRRLDELTALRSQLDTYREHIDARIAEGGAQSDPEEDTDEVASENRSATP
jgi:DNA-binding transcriptional MerR regulator